MFVQTIATNIAALSVGLTITDASINEALLSRLNIDIETCIVCYAGIIIGKITGTKLTNKVKCVWTIYKRSFIRTFYILCLAFANAVFIWFTLAQWLQLPEQLEHDPLFLIDLKAVTMSDIKISEIMMVASILFPFVSKVFLLTSKS